MPEIRIYRHRPERNNLIICSKPAGWWTNGIHQANPPHDFCPEAGSQKLNIYVAQLLEDTIFAFVCGVGVAKILLKFVVGISSLVHVPDPLVVAEEREHRSGILLLSRVTSQHSRQVNIVPSPSSGVAVQVLAAHPLTAPWSSAAMIWRWNRIKTTNVGTRSNSVPAHSRGISVA